MAVLASSSRRRLAFAACFVAVLGVVHAAAATRTQAEPEEYDVKAAFLYQFTRFVEWPADAFGDRRAPVVLCLAGEDPFGARLDGLLAGKSVEGRALKVTRLRGAPATGCHVVFVGPGDRRRATEVLDQAAGKPMLTIGDMPGFARNGGVANFVLDQNRVRFEINPAAAERARLKVSSKLLSLARLVAADGTR